MRALRVYRILLNLSFRAWPVKGTHLHITWHTRKNQKLVVRIALGDIWLRINPLLYDRRILHTSTTWINSKRRSCKKRKNARNETSVSCGGTRFFSLSSMFVVVQLSRSLSVASPLFECHSIDRHLLSSSGRLISSVGRRRFIYGEVSLEWFRFLFDLANISSISSSLK